MVYLMAFADFWFATVPRRLMGVLDLGFFACDAALYGFYGRGVGTFWALWIPRLFTQV